MAPSEAHVEWQTCEIIRCLFEDDDVKSRTLYGFSERDSGLEGSIESDSAVADDFDPVLIADKLRSVADSLNDDVRFKAALTGLKKAAAQEAVNAAFDLGVLTLCETNVSQGAEVTSEIQLIRASVAFGLYVKKSSPELKNKVQSAMMAFLNRRVSGWVSQQGGWDKVTGF